MEFHFADISPGVIGIIIWSLVSYFINKSKNKKNKLEDNKHLEDNDSTNFQFDSIIDPQNSFSFNDLTDNELIEDEILFEDSTQGPDTPANSHDLMIDEIQQKSQIEISNKTYVKATYLDQLKSRKSLKNSFILKEILDKPVSLRNG